MPAITRWSLYILLCVVGSILLSACSPSSDDPVPAADGDWEAADLMDSDSDNTGDDDAMEDDADATAEENGAEEEFFDTEEAEADNADMEPDSDTEVDTEVEAEEETPAQPGVITVEELPWEGLTVQSCSEDMDSDASIARSYTVWSDGLTTTYFGGDHFWVLVENGETQTLSCDAGMIWPMYSMDGRSGDTGNELWTGHDRRIGHYINHQWTFMDLPAEMLTEEEIGGENTVVDIDIAGDVISVLTRKKLGLYKPDTDQWHMPEECPENLNRNHGLTWDGEKLWASAGVVLYTVNPETAAFHEEITVVENADARGTIGITGSTEEGLWMVLYPDASHAVAPSTWIALYTGEQLHYYTVPLTGDLSLWMSVSPGMGGRPFLYFWFSTSVTQDSTFGWTARNYHVQMSRLIDDGPESISAPSIKICSEEVHGGTMFCFSQISSTGGILNRSPSWRGTNSLWHMYDTPRRYRW